MEGRLEDVTCKDCGTRWGDVGGSSWLFRFDDDPDWEQNRLLWVQCPRCQPDELRFKVSVTEDIHRLPGS